MPVLLDRLEIIKALPIKHGAHGSFNKGACVMEMVAFAAGQPHSDQPPCVCPVIGTFLRSWNDGLPSDDARSELLKPLIPKVIETKATLEVELARVMLCIDWLCREFTPAWLETVPSLTHHAETLRAFKPLQSWDDLDAILSPMRSAQGPLHGTLHGPLQGTHLNLPPNDCRSRPSLLSRGWPH